MPNALVRAYEDWDGTSAQLVEAATIAFGFLLLPQACRAPPTQSLATCRFGA